MSDMPREIWAGWREQRGEPDNWSGCDDGRTEYIRADLTQAAEIERGDKVVVGRDRKPILAMYQEYDGDDKHLPQPPASEGK